MYDKCDISVLLGKTLTSIKVYNDQDHLDFYTLDNESYKMLHDTDCCEQVWLEDITGDLCDLLNSPILVAEERTNSEEAGIANYDDFYQWTYYELATIKGRVTLRWYGNSNGYYSVDVSIYKVK